MLAIVQEESSFGSVLDLDILGISLSDDTLIPGVAIAWTNALEISPIDVNRQRACLLLSAGVSKR